MRTPRNRAAVLAASERAAWFLIEQGRFDAPIAQIAEAIGLHERTFYRYFPTKADALRPLFDWGATVIADRIVEATDRPIAQAVLDAFVEVVGGDQDVRTRQLFPLVFADPALRATLLAVYHDAEEELRFALSHRTGRDPTDPTVYLDAAVIVTQTRIALELLVDQGLDPVQALRAILNDPSGAHAEHPHQK